MIRAHTTSRATATSACTTGAQGATSFHSTPERRIRRNHQRLGFTLFEIALSLMLITYGIVSIMVLIPIGLKAQQKSRFELLASTQAMQMLEFFGGKSNGERIADFETPEPWEARPFCYSSTRWDLETRLSRWDSGIMPVPPDIALRLDSDNDEIRTLLTQGGYLYYADARSIPSIDPQYINVSPANESQKLVFAVSGYAQNNAIPVFPHKAWPYRAAYPSPPMYAVFQPNLQFTPQITSQVTSTPIGFESSLEGWSTGVPDAQPPSNRDPLMDGIFQAAVAYETALTDAIPPFSNRQAAIAPVQAPLQQAVLAFCVDKFQRITNPLGPLPISGSGGMAEYQTYYLCPGVTDFMTLGQNYDADFAALCQRVEQAPGEPYNRAKATTRAEISLRVQCMRFLAFVMSTYYIQQQGEAAPDLTQVQFQNGPLTVDRLRYYQDRCKFLAMRYAASCPYDWGAPRPIVRSIMMDHPLMEYDLFSPPRTGIIVGTTPAVPAAMWKPIASQTVTSIGMPAAYPGVLSGGQFDNTQSPFVPMDNRASGQPFWGDASHFTLTRPFSPAERCRQIVFWSVDWQSYEDAETAPSAPMDASKSPLYGLDAGNIKEQYWARLGVWLPYQDGLYLRNPERMLTFTQDISGLATGTPVSSMMINGGNADVALPVLNGVYGADRNHNYMLDRGPQSRAVRLYATQIARFNFYDPRIPITLR